MEKTKQDTRDKDDPTLEHIEACVNALAGVGDPKSYSIAVRELVEAAEAYKYDVEDTAPDSWEECPTCDNYHPAEFTGDCREDRSRWPSNLAVERIRMDQHTRLRAALAAVKGEK